MARVETDDIIEKVEVKEDDISLTDDDIKSAELLSLEKIEYITCSIPKTKKIIPKMNSILFIKVCGKINNNNTIINSKAALIIGIYETLNFLIIIPLSYNIYFTIFFSF